MVSLNARSIANKTDALETLLISYDPHICVITETWLHDDINDDEIVPPGYHLYRRDRGARGGGVAVVTKEYVDVTVCEQIAAHESLLLKLCLFGVNFFLCAVYRAPDADDFFLDRLYDHLQGFGGRNVVITGDFNLPSIHWSSLNYGISRSADAVLDMMFYLNLEQRVREFTRGTAILDLLFTTEFFHSSEVSVEEGISDHKLVFLRWLSQNHTRQKKIQRVVKDFSRADDVTIIDYLDIQFDNVVNNVEISWKKFCGAIKFCVNNYVPSRNLRSRRFTPWITRDIIHTKRKMKRLRRHHNTTTTRFHELRQELLAKVRESRSNYFGHRLTAFIKSDARKFWRHLNGSKKEIKKIKIGDATISDPPEIAEHFNGYFQSVFTAAEEFRVHSTHSAGADDLVVSREGVTAMLLKLDAKKPSGPDDIPNSFLRRYAEQLSPFLTDIFNLSLATGEIPHDWRKARVVPIYKNGDRLSVSNYRPISITSTCCKLFEHVIATYIRDFLESRNFLSQYQHGFRKHMSTVTQLVCTVHDFAQALDMNGQLDALFLDFSKAFDKVPHGKLLYKLECIGLPSCVLQWIRAYLRDRQQFVEIMNFSSKTLSVTSGVPQGSVLGPLLFLIYINDLSDVVHGGVAIRLFADDCVLFKNITAPNDHTILQANLEAIHEWCIRWGMQLNAQKTVLLRVTRKKNISTYSYLLNNNIITEVDTHKYLGVTLTNKLTWSPHISAICSSAISKLWSLKRKLKGAPVEVKLLAYNACIRAKLEYASIVWDPHNKKDILQLERVQRKAVRFIFSKYKRHDSPSLLMRQHSIGTLESRRKISRLAFLHNCVSGTLRLNMPDCVKPHCTRKTRHTHPHSLAPIFARTNTYKHSFFPRTTSEWNSLPSHTFAACDFVKELERQFLRC